MENKMYAGFASVDITPYMGLNIQGYYHARYATGIEDPLCLRAAAFAFGEEKAIVFNCEAIGIKAVAFDVVKKKVAATCGISEDAVYVNCVHTHTGFRIFGADTEPDKITELDVFLLWVYQRFVDCARFAFEDLKPCSILTAVGEAKNIGFSRRYRMVDGTVRTNPPSRDPNIAGPIGGPDEQVRIIRICREDAKEIMLVHFGTHADTIGGTKVSPDWPGYAVHTLDRALGGEVNTMFLLGAEGDCGTRNAVNPDVIAKGVGRAKAIARRLASAVLRIYDLAEPAAADTLRVAHRYVQVGKNTYDPADLPMVEEIVRIYREKGDKAPELLEFPMKHTEALRIKANLSRPEFFDLRISGLRVGDIAFIGFPGEPFASIGMEIVSKSPLPMTLVTACTNGCEGYYPDVQAYKERGYCYERAASPFAPDCADHLISGALAVLKELYK